MEKAVGLVLVVGSLLLTVLFVVPRMIDGFQMGGASVCSSGETEDCLEEVKVAVTEREDGLRKDVGPIRWHLKVKGKGEDEQILRTAWLGDELVVGSHVSLQRWEGDPVAVRVRGNEVHSLAWGANRWILWAAGALGLLLPGLTLLYHSLKPRPTDDEEPVDPVTVAAAQGMLAGVAALFMYPAFSAAGALGAVIVLGGWLWLAGALMIRGPKRESQSTQARGLA